jgi:ABC-type transport system involved in cytochrome bd biosynthesis fused ATPase/permease subunit
MAKEQADYDATLSRNNFMQQTINQYTKSYYDLIFGQNSKLSNRINDTQYTDFYSTDGQKSRYVSNDNEYLRALNYTFLIVYYILAIIVLYVIYNLNMTQFSKIVMAVIILLYPLFIYSLQHSLHYLWVNFSTTP